MRRKGVSGRRRFPPLLEVIATVLVALFAHVSGAPAAEARFGDLAIRHPEGFRIERVAGPPLVERPIVADLDEEGRLYVADSSGSNAPVREQLKTRPHRIVRLEDTDGDGVFDRSTVFADRMMFPEGVLWYRGSLYVGAPPEIWRLRDGDGDGIAEEREVWFDGKTLTGCANDLHGPYLGRDGWLYWCKGAFAEQRYERPGAPPFVTRAAHIFRRRLGGGIVEPVMTGGMDNPVEVVFTPEGERIFTTTFLTHPRGGKRDGIIHALYGGVYGKEHGVLEGHPRTGGLLPPLVHLGPAAPCGLALYESRGFGDEYRGNLFACLFNLHEVARFPLEPEGAGFTTQKFEFLVSDHRDFHPTDVLEDADGSLLVVDTGGWYKICCPTSQLFKPDVLGAIYRVRRVGAHKIEDPRGLALRWGERAEAVELAARLGDPRPAVRRRAVDESALKGGGAVPVLAAWLRDPNAHGEEARRNAVWALARIEGEEARAAVRAGLGDPSPSVRHAALHAVSVWRDRAAAGAVVSLLEDRSPAVRRAAAEALGRIGGPEAVPALLRALEGVKDRRLEHSLIYAVIEIGAPEPARKELAAAGPAVRKGALIALSEMPGGRLTSADVLPLLSASDTALCDAAWRIAEGRPEWAPALVSELARNLAAPDAADRGAARAVEAAAALAGTEAIASLIARMLEDPDLPPAASRRVLEVLRRARIKSAPAVWAEALARRLLRSGDPNDLAVLLDTVSRLKFDHDATDALKAALRKIAESTHIAPELRLAALAASPGGEALPPPLFALAFDSATRGASRKERSLGVQVLAAARLDPGELERLARAVAEVHPLDLPKVIEIFAAVADRKPLEALLETLENEPPPGLRADLLEKALSKAPEDLRKRGKDILRRLGGDAEARRRRIEELLASLPAGDVRRGQAVFNSEKAACSKCHAIGYLGGTIGPDLTRIGQVRSELDLLEALVFPSASFVRGYEPVTVVKRDGTVHSGVLRDEGDAVVVFTGADTSVRIERAEIHEIRPGSVSIMPSGLTELLKPQELADLLAFLKAARR